MQQPAILKEQAAAQSQEKNVRNSSSYDPINQGAKAFSEIENAFSNLAVRVEQYQKIWHVINNQFREELHTDVKRLKDSPDYQALVDQAKTIQFQRDKGIKNVTPDDGEKVVRYVEKLDKLLERAEKFQKVRPVAAIINSQISEHLKHMKKSQTKNSGSLLDKFVSLDKQESKMDVKQNDRPSTKSR